MKLGRGCAGAGMGGLRLWAAFALHACRGLARAQAPGFLLVSAPRLSKISWVRLPEDGSPLGMKPRTLIDEGLHRPQGIAVDQRRKRLFVADPDVQRIYCYQLQVSDGGLRTEGQPRVVARGTESRWVAVDGTGSVFFSDEPRSLILRLPASWLLRGGAPEVAYSGGALARVSAPGGVAADNLRVYWTNKRLGTQAGSVVAGAETLAPGPVSVLARNSVKSYGLCLALGNVYYTDARRSLYGVKKSGGRATEVSSALSHPRGCAWDGDGTVYVADRAGAVYSFAGNMRTISKAEVRKAFDFEDAFGLAAVMSAASGARGSLPATVATLAAAALLLRMEQR